MNQLTKAAVVFAFVWAGLSIFKKVVDRIEDEDLARLGAGESDFQRHYVKTDCV